MKIAAMKILNIRERNKLLKQSKQSDCTARGDPFLFLFSLHASVGLVKTMERVLHITRRTVMCAHAPRVTQENIVKQVSSVPAFCNSQQQQDWEESNSVSGHPGDPK